MNCAVHADRECTAACRCCGSLICQVCDVVCGGQHFCKKCIALGDAIPVRLSFRRDKGRRAPILLGIDWLIKRWPALLALSVGLVTLSSALLCMSINDAASGFSYQYSSNGFSTSHSSWSGIPISRMALSIWMQAGALLVVGAILMLVRRFGLRWLMAAVLVVGLTGAIPFAFIDGEPHLTQVISVNTPNPLNKSDTRRLQSCLEPQNALKTLPQALLDEIKLKPGEAVMRVKATRESDGYEVRLKIEYQDSLDDRQRATLEEFYQVYATTLALELGDPLNTISRNQVSPVTSSTDSVWPQYESEWKARHTPLNAVATHF
jgi:hypothetical protein